ncbi:MAG: 3'-5' exonuclease [Sphingomonadales bacterium]|nr:3'-5' exonuclease [Sphingomonadales bacterium]
MARFAVVDIECTGSKFPAHRLIEVGVVFHDGHKITGSWERLVNPGQPIPEFVARMTGISQEMVNVAPPFKSIACELYHLLSGCVFVAHDVSFDYRFLQAEFEAAEMRFEADRLCTLSLSRQHMPDEPSYSLGKLCRSLGMETENRHRAAGDAYLTARLFGLLFPLLGDWTVELNRG